MTRVEVLSIMSAFLVSILSGWVAWTIIQGLAP